MDEIVSERKTLGYLTTSRLEKDWLARRAVERDLQVLTEILIDVCQWLITLAGRPPSTTGADAVQRCVEMGVLPSPEPYRKMVQFRNFIVHRYERIDVTILVEIVNNRLDDFESFRRLVMDYVAR